MKSHQYCQTWLRWSILFRASASSGTPGGGRSVGVLKSSVGQATGAWRQLIGRSFATGRGSVPRSFAHVLQDWKQLSKFKLSSFVVLTSATGYVAGSGTDVNWSQLAWTALGTFGAAACANTLNQIYERNNDRLMSRTCNRPLPAGRLGVGHALTFAVVCGLLGLGTLAAQTNELTTALGAANIVLYAAVYTPLKQVSIANTWVGAVVGAIPPLMGWTSAAGTVEPAALVLPSVLFFWQMPHFLALAWFCKQDYIRGGFRMLSMVDPQGQRTAKVALRHSLYLLPMGVLAVFMGMANTSFAYESTLLSAGMLASAAWFYRHPSITNARKMFRVSLLYLPALMVTLPLHREPNTHSITWEDLKEAGYQQGFHLYTSFMGTWSSLVGYSSQVKCPSRVYSDTTDRDGLQGEQEMKGSWLEEEQEEQEEQEGTPVERDITHTPQ